MGKHPIRCGFMCPLRIALTLGQVAHATSGRPSNVKMRRHEKRNESRSGKENQQEVTPNECLCPPPHT